MPAAYRSRELLFLHCMVTERTAGLHWVGNPPGVFTPEHIRKKRRLLGSEQPQQSMECTGEGKGVLTLGSNSPTDTGHIYVQQNTGGHAIGTGLFAVARHLSLWQLGPNFFSEDFLIYACCRALLFFNSMLTLFHTCGPFCLIQGQNRQFRHQT